MKKITLLGSSVKELTHAHQTAQIQLKTPTNDKLYPILPIDLDYIIIG